jgi:hypothetical protein
MRTMMRIFRNTLLLTAGHEHLRLTKRKNLRNISEGLSPEKSTEELSALLFKLPDVP